MMRIGHSKISGLLTYLDPLFYIFFTFKKQEGYICRMREDTLEARDSEEDSRVENEEKLIEGFQCNTRKNPVSAL